MSPLRSRGAERTGAIYELAAPERAASREPGVWNHFSIAYIGQQYVVTLNGVEVSHFTGDGGTDGYVGLQHHDPDSRVRFRRVEMEFPRRGE